MRKIRLVPIGNIANEILARLQRSLEQTFGRRVEIDPQLEEPGYAYDPKRKQYHSTAILACIRASVPGDGDRILGVADVDLYVPQLNFVFGEAHTGWGVAVISLCRLRQERYGLPQDNVLFEERAVKEAVHELGHTYALGHCRDPECVMHFSNSLADTDRKAASFCGDCDRLLRRELG